MVEDVARSRRYLWAPGEFSDAPTALAFFLVAGEALPAFLKPPGGTCRGVVLGAGRVSSRRTSPRHVIRWTATAKHDAITAQSA